MFGIHNLNPQTTESLSHQFAVQYWSYKSIIFDMCVIPTFFNMTICFLTLLHISRVEWGKMPPLRKNCKLIRASQWCACFCVTCDRYGNKATHPVQFWFHIFIFAKKNQYKIPCLTVVTYPYHESKMISTLLQNFNATGNAEAVNNSRFQGPILK